LGIELEFMGILGCQGRNPGPSCGTHLPMGHDYPITLDPFHQSFLMHLNCGFSLF
jgi:hypothetical protein